MLKVSLYSMRVEQPKYIYAPMKYFELNIILYLIPVQLNLLNINLYRPIEHAIRQEPN